MIRNLMFLLFITFVFPWNSNAATNNGNDSICTWKANAVSNDWDAAENWENGSVPGQNCYVFVMEGFFQPNIVNNVSIKQLTVKQDAVLNVSNPGSLFISDSLTLKKRSILNIKPRGSVKVNGPTRLEGMNCLVVKSDETGTGSFIDNGIISGSGTAKIQQYAEGLKWQMISSPVGGALSGLFLYQYLKPFLEAGNTLGENIINPATPLLTGSGYGLWPIGSQTFEYTGKPNTGTISTGISYTDASKGYNLVGNPFPSAIDWDAPSGWEGNSGISDWLIIFNPAINNYGMYLRNSGTGTNGVSNIIPPGQGYFVRAMDASPHFSVSNSARVNNTSVPFFKSEESTTSLKFNVSGASGSDEVIVKFQPGSSEYFDPKEDGLKFFGPSGSPQAYMVTQPSGTKISVNTLPSVTPDLQIPLFIEFGIEGSYSISASGISSFPSGINVFLEDKKNGNSVNLAAVTTYAFDVLPGDPADRFKIRILSGPIGIQDVNPDQSVKIHSSANHVYVSCPSNSTRPSTLAVFDMIGRQVTGNIELKEQNSQVSLNVSTGYYVVKVMSPSGIFSEKIFIQ